MLTYEKVLMIFEDYLALDHEIEVFKSRYGYVRVEYEGDGRYCSGEVSKTPEELFGLLLSDYQSYTEIQLTQGNRDLTEEDNIQVAALCQRYWKQREEETI